MSKATMQAYQPKVRTTMACEIKEAPTRLNMTSDVYTYRQFEFRSNVRPTVGDFLIDGKLHMARKKFQSMYEVQ